jgi:hypothetical protein
MPDQASGHYDAVLANIPCHATPGAGLAAVPTSWQAVINAGGCYARQTDS